MAFCANCGAALTQASGFCGSCGQAIGGPARVAVPATVPAQPAPVATSAVGSASGLTSNIAGALSYLLGFITGILFLVIEPYKHDRFVRFHAMQSVMFSVSCIVFSIAWGILVGILSEISAWVALATLPIRILISLGFFVLWLFVMYQAYSQKEFRIPFIGNLAAKQAGLA